MLPFVLKQHDRDYSQIRTLREEEIAAVNGAACKSPVNDVSKSSTYTVTANSDGGDDGCDEG